MRGNRANRRARGRGRGRGGRGRGRSKKSSKVSDLITSSYLSCHISYSDVDIQKCFDFTQALESDEEEMPMPSGEEAVEESDEQGGGDRGDKLAPEQQQC